MKIPTKEECFDLIRQMGMMEHIIEHSIMVSNVALFLSTKLEKKNDCINSKLAWTAALLHDITKTRSFKTGEFHAQTGREFMDDQGYPEIADIIRQHVVLDSYDLQSPVTEVEIVNYSDKRILHDKIVSLEERLEYIKERYGTKKEFMDGIQKMWKNTIILEKKLFKNLEFSPESLEELIPKKHHSTTKHCTILKRSST